MTTAIDVLRKQVAAFNGREFTSKDILVKDARIGSRLCKLEEGGELVRCGKRHGATLFRATPRLKAVAEDIPVSIVATGGFKLPNWRRAWPGLAV